MGKELTNGQVIKRGLQKYKGKHNKTYQQYREHCLAMKKWADENKKGRVFNQKGIQEYADYLALKGLKADTIHTYIAACCQIARINENEINKPSRTADKLERSRSDSKNMRGHDELRSGRFNRSVEFEKIVGIRRSELGELFGRNFKLDESGYWCVEVEHGKGGKYQLQRVLPKDIEAVREYFARGNEETVFKSPELANKIDYHKLRGEHARECYEYYLERINNEPEYKNQLRKELCDRWDKSNDPKKSDYNFKKEVYNNSPYKTRGANKQRLKELNRPTEYDRTALLAVSVFHLSHWRNDVTVRNYM